MKQMLKWVGCPPPNLAEHSQGQGEETLLCTTSHQPSRIHTRGPCVPAPRCAPCWATRFHSRVGERGALPSLLPPHLPRGSTWSITCPQPQAQLGNKGFAFPKGQSELPRGTPFPRHVLSW